MQLSKKIFQLETENSFTVLAKANELAAKGVGDITLAIGQPDFQTPKNIQEAAIKAIKDGKHGYTASNGILELREAISNMLLTDYNNKISHEEILITPGGKPVIFF